MFEENKNRPGTLSRRDFLKDAGIMVGTTAVGSAFFLSACGKETEITKTITTTVPGSTITTTIPGASTTIIPTSTEETVKYLCPVCDGEFESFINLKTHFELEHSAEGQIVQRKNWVNININKQPYELNVEPNWTLLKVLRETVGLTGTKVSCDEGQCGMCTVLKDGAPVLSCLLLAIECDGANITTIEGIASKEALDPIQESFLYHNVPQCGFCQPSMILIIRDLLNKNNAPTEEEILGAISGVQCRCGTYPRVVKATQSILANT